MAFATVNKPVVQSGSKQICDDCQKLGHDITVYFQLNGSPDWRAERTKLNGSNNGRERGSGRISVAIARGRGRQLRAGRGTSPVANNNSSTLGGWANMAHDVGETAVNND